MRKIIMAVVLGLGMAGGLGGAGFLGPPGVCNEIEVGDSASALDAAWKGVRAGNIAARLPGILDQFAGNTTVRMEALRRAALLDGSPSEEVVGALALRALEKETAGEGVASAVFDVGYSIHLYSTLGTDWASKRAQHEGIAGYALVRRAIDLGADAGMQVGAAYMTLPAMQPRSETRIARARELFKEHVEAALRSCAPNSPEERNLAFVLQFENETVGSVRARLSK